jgi:hypothetical protein
MTPRQQRRLQQKLARKAEKRALRTDVPSTAPVSAAQTEQRASATGRFAVSEAKLQANRANAQLSTGAVTPAGKQVISQNAVRHGLTGKFHVLAGESQSDFDQLLTSYMRTESPIDQEEVELVRQLAEATWLSARAVRCQNNCFVALESESLEEQKQAKKDLMLYMRYQSMHDRAYGRCSSELRRHRNERRRAERGFVSQKYREANERRKEAQENRKKELHELRQAIQISRQETIQIRNRIAAAKAERLELQNAAKKEVKTLAAAA